MTSSKDFAADIKPFFADRRIVYVDIGAFHGEVYCNLKDKNIKFREAHLVEPHPQSFLVLEKEIIDDGRATAYNLAISRESAGMALLAMDSSPTMSRIVNVNDVFDLSSGSSNNRFEVKSVSYDSLAKGFWGGGASVGLVKIDVEGHELSVIEGAASSLKNESIDVIYIEAGLDPGNTQQTYYRKIEDALAQYGYKIFKIYEQKNEWIDDSPLLRRINLAFFSNKFARFHPPSVVHAVDKLRIEMEAAEQNAANLRKQFAIQAETLQQAQKARDEQASRVKVLEGELATLKDERDASAKDKAAAHQSATELIQQLAAQAETLQQTQKARDEQTARVKALESELAALLAELDFEQRIKQVEEQAKQLETAYNFKLKT